MQYGVHGGLLDHRCVLARHRRGRGSEPGSFVGAALNITLSGGNTNGAGMGLAYSVTLSAQVVKK